MIVHGVVQGVGFRYWLAREAESRGVAGSARNLWDGTVEVVLEGELEAVETMVGRCRQGPRGAVVVHVEVEEVAPEGLRGFEIR